MPRVTLSLSARVLTRLRGVRSVRAYAAAGIIPALAATRALRMAPDSLGHCCGNLHAAAKPHPLRCSLSSHFEREATIDQQPNRRCGRWVTRQVQIDAGAGLECRHARFAICPCGRGGLHELRQPHGRVPSVSCLRNDSCTAALSETQHHLARSRGKRTGGTTQASTHGNALRIAAARGSAGAPSCDTASTYATHIYDTARGSHHDDRPPVPRLPLDL